MILSPILLFIFLYLRAGEFLNVKVCISVWLRYSSDRGTGWVQQKCDHFYSTSSVTGTYMGDLPLIRQIMDKENTH